LPEDTEKPRLLDQVRDAIRYSIRTERAYVEWIRRYIHFHRLRHPSDMGSREVSQFLTYLAVHRKVAASTQNQALNALQFLYRVVLREPIEILDDTVRAKLPHRLPVVLTEQEVAAVLRHLTGEQWLMVGLMYGSGLRLLECLRIGKITWLFADCSEYGSWGCWRTQTETSRGMLAMDLTSYTGWGHWRTDDRVNGEARE
jgi:site-specific recombinase XerD